jgi:hypothetical protein
MSLLQSRRFVLGVLSIVYFTLPMLFPQFAQQIEIAAPYIAPIIIAAILGFSLEDAIRAWREAPVSLKQAILDAIDELFPPDEEEEAVNFTADPRIVGEAKG